MPFCRALSARCISRDFCILWELPGWLHPLQRQMPMWDGEWFKELKGMVKPDGQLASPKNGSDTALSIALWVLILFQSYPGLAMGPFLPVPQFPYTKKSSSGCSTCKKHLLKKKLHNVTKLKQNFPMNLPLHFRFRPVMTTEQHCSACVHLGAFISLSAPQTQAENSHSSCPLHQPLPDSLSRRSR